MTPQLVKKNNINITGNLEAEKTIMFGHGFGIDQTTFADVSRAFEQDYRVVLYDNIGNGNADIAAYSPNRYNSLNGYVADLSDILKGVEAKDFIYVGHSVNGMISLLASVKNPSWFSKLILLGASPRYLNDAANDYTGGFEQSDLDGLYDAMQTNYHAWASGFSAMVMNNPDRPHLAQAFANTLSAMRPDVALCIAKAIFESDCRADLPKATVPTLIVQTTDDIAVPVSVGDYMHEYIQGSSLVQVNTKGHYPHISAPEEVIAAIKSFL